MLDPLALAASARRRPGAPPPAAAAEAEAAAALAVEGVSWQELQRERYRDLDPSREHELQVSLHTQVGVALHRQTACLRRCVKEEQRAGAGLCGRGPHCLGWRVPCGAPSATASSLPPSLLQQHGRLLPRGGRAPSPSPSSSSEEEEQGRAGRGYAGALPPPLPPPGFAAVPFSYGGQPEEANEEGGPGYAGELPPPPSPPPLPRYAGELPPPPSAPPGYSAMPFEYGGGQEEEAGEQHWYSAVGFSYGEQQQEAAEAAHQRQHAAPPAQQQQQQQQQQQEDEGPPFVANFPVSAQLRGHLPTAQRQYQVGLGIRAAMSCPAPSCPALSCRHERPPPALHPCPTPPTSTRPVCYHRVQLLRQTADFVRRGGAQLEVLLRVKQAGDRRFTFLEPADRLHPFYRCARLREGETLAGLGRS